MNSGLYSIGEISKMFNLSVQTLRHYEKIGLLIPSKKSNDTGYRYYTWNQFERLRLIICLKDMGVSLKDIKYQLNIQRGSEYIKLLENHSDTLNRRIQSDTELKQHVDRKIESMKQTSFLPHNKTLYIHFPELKILKYYCKVSCFYDSEISVAKFIREFQLRPGISRIGQLFSPSLLVNQEGTIVSTGLYVLEEMFTDETLKRAGDSITVIPGGTYAVMYYREPTEKTLPYAYQLLDEVKQKSLVPCSEIFRQIHCDVGREHPEEDGYLASIRILVKKNNE